MITRTPRRLQRLFRVRTVRWICLTVCGLGLAARLPAQTWMNTSLSASQRASLLVASMTQAEQLAMVSGNPNGYIGNLPGNGRLGIPSLNFQDGPAGAGDGHTGATALPAPVCLAATWDVALARQYGTCVGQEQRGKGAQVTLGPTMNMARAYQNGRNCESFGEDPYLAAIIAATDIQGIQSQGVIANSKHLACNDQETDRFLISADVDERTRQEIYYPPFRACVQSGLGSFMASYNRINGLHASEHPFLNATVKKLWGFDGFIESDWAAYLGTVTAADNGLDIDMYNGAFSGTPLGNAIGAGLVPGAELSDKVHRILTSMFQNGDFDNPSTGNINATVTTTANQVVSRNCAAAGTVLLQNNHSVLPLKTNLVHSIAVIGSVANASAIYTALGSSGVELVYSVTPLTGISSRAGGAVTVNYSQGDGGNIPAAVALAQSSSVAIICVGQRTGEGADRTSLSLPGDQDALISAVAAVNTNTIVVVYCSSSTLMPWSTNIAASLVAWFPGLENGNALAQVLFGDVNPSGRLPVTIPATASQVPANTTAQFPGINGHVTYSEGLNMGYRWYDASNVPPQFPFGHGLSYTTFGYSNLVVGAVSPSGQVQIGFDLKNTGSLTGAEVSQLYLGFPAAAGEPPKLLKGFTKVPLAPGQTQHVTFNLDWQDLANWDATARGWLVTPGTFQVYVGASSRDLRLTNSFSVTSVPSSDLANAALHQIATASSGTNFGAPVVAPVYGANFGAMVDGNPATGWRSAVSDPQWCMVDLGLIKDLSRVRLQWNTNYASAFSIQLSTNASTWTTIFTTNGDQGGVEDILVSGQGRYVRMLGATQGLPGAGYGIQEFEVYSPQQAPYGGSVPVLPAQVEAENFDNGGEGVGYYNTTVGNAGGVYRTNVDVGIEPCTDTGGGYDVGYVQPGEWLEYTVNAPDPEAVYSVNVRVASGSGGGQLRVRLDGTLLGTVNIPNTGGWQTWQTITLPNVPIAGGTGSRALRVEVINGGFNFNWIQLNQVQICSTTNITLKQPAWSSSGGSASPAFDGDCRSYWSSSASDPQWLVVDLGAIVNVARIRLDWVTQNWNNNGYGQAEFSQSFSLQFSSDGNSWTNAYSTTNGFGSLNDLAVAGNARYVRLYSTQRINGLGIGLYEFEVYPGSPVQTFPNTSTNGVANPSFEAQVVTDGSFISGDPLFWHSALFGGAVDAVINPGVSDGRGFGSTPVGLDGTNICQIFAGTSGGGGMVYQDSGIKFQAGTTYQLTAAFGLQTSQTFDAGSTMGLYNSSLTAVTNKTISPANLIAGAFTNQNLLYTATGTEGGNGDIIVGFYAPPAASVNSYFDFDNVQLAVFTTNTLIIIIPPVSQMTIAGNTASFSVVAAGAAPFSYQWQATNSAAGGFTNLVNGGQVSGATSNILTIANASTNWTLAYQVIVTNSVGSVTSAPPVTLTVVTSPVITSGPVSQSALAGSPVSFSVSALGVALVSYQWQTNGGSGWGNLVNGGIITGATSNVLSFASVTTNWALSYQVIVSNSYGSVTSTPAATLTVVSIPVITTQPVSQTVLPGQTVSLSAAAIGPAPLSYQWQAQPLGGGTFTNLVNGGSISGAASNVLTFANVTTNWNLSYQLIVANSYGSVTSSVVFLSVLTSTVLIDGDFGSGATQSGAAVLGSAGDAWNAITVSTGTLRNSAGTTVSGVGLTLSDQGVFTDASGDAMDSGTSALMQDYAYGNTTPATVTVTFTGLSKYTNSLFALVVYAAGDAAGQGGSLTLTGGTGGNTATTLTTTAASRQVSAGPGVAYNTFSGTLASGTLTLVVSANGSVYSIVNGFQLLLSGQLPPVITTEPVSQTNNVGSAVSFNVIATGATPLGYQWQARPVAGGTFTNVVNGGPVSGVTSNILSFANVTTNWALAYQVIVTNSVGSVTSSPVATLTLLDSPVITTQPVSQTNSVGSAVAFNVVALGASPLTYQWQARSVGGGTFTNLVNGVPVSGATSNVLTLSQVATNWTLAYQVIVTNRYGAVTSSPAATLTVAPVSNLLSNSIAIQNFSFEAQTVASNNFVVENPTSWTVANQSGGALVAIVHPGAGDGRFGLGNIPAGFDGSNYCQLYMNGSSGSVTVYQDTGIKYQAGSTYTLTAAFGLEKKGFPTGALVLYNSSLVAIASNVITSAMLTANAFTSFSVIYTGTGTEGGNGDIVVGFNTTNAAASSSFDIDNLRLVAVSTPPVSSNAYLTSLMLSPAGILSPAFVSNTFTYYATNAYGSAPTVTVTNADLTATNQLIYNGTTNGLSSGSTSGGVALTLGATNVVQVQVTAQDGVTVQTYTVNVTELPNQATPPLLTNSVNGGTLNLTWGLDRLGYRLLMQTSNLNLGVSGSANDWTMVPGSTTTNAAAISIVTTNLNEYFRLVYP